MGGGGSTEYRRAGGVGPLTIFRNCAMDGGLGRRSGDSFTLSTACTLTLLGFVAIFAFSCSSRASSVAVDYNSGKG